MNNIIRTEPNITKYQVKPLTCLDLLYNDCMSTVQLEVVKYSKTFEM